MSFRFTAMFQQSAMLCVFLCCVGMSVGAAIPNYNLTVTVRRNETGHLYSDVHLEHDSDEEWAVQVNDTSTGSSRWSQTIIIYPVGKSDNSSIIGYEQIPDFGYYKLHSEHKNWQDAQKTCVKEKAHLLVIERDREAHLVGTLLENNNMKSQHQWASSDVDTSIAGSCKSFYFNSVDDFSVSERECSEALPFVCEKKKLE